MKTKQSKISPQLQLAKEVETLTSEVKKLKDMEFIQVFKHPLKFMWFAFLKGLMVGFGSVLGASVLVGLFVYIMGQISLIPIIGDFVQDIVSQVQGEEVQVEKQVNN